MMERRSVIRGGGRNITVIALKQLLPPIAAPWSGGGVKT